MNPFPTRDAAEAYLSRIPDPAQRASTRTRLGLDEPSTPPAPVVHAAPQPAPSAAPRVDEVLAVLPPPRPPAPLSGVLTFALPWPPSVNAIWRAIIITGRDGKPQARVVLSAEGKVYRRAVRERMVAYRTWGAYQTPPGARLGVHLHASPPDNRARDLSNLPKALEDALTYAHVWADDSLIDELRVTRGPVVPGGRVDVVITPLTSTLFRGTS